MLTPLLPLSLPGLVVEHVSTAAPMLLIDAHTSTRINGMMLLANSGSLRF
jgi:hypothetical protein